VDCHPRTPAIGRIAHDQPDNFKSVDLAAFTLPVVNDTSTTPLRATLLIVLSACSFGALSTLAVLAQRQGLTIVGAMAWRYTIGSAILFYPALRALRASTLPVPTERAIRLVLIGALGQALITYTSLYALRYIPVGLLAFLFYTYPAWLAIISTVRRTESITGMRMVALAISLLGLAIMAGPISPGATNAKGVAIALGAAVLYAIYLPTLRSTQQGIAPMLATFLLVLGATMSFVVVAVGTGNFAPPATPSGWAIIVLLGTLCTSVAFAALLNGLRILGPVRTSIVATIEPFFTAVLGAVLLLEPLTIRTLLGGTMVALAVVLLQLRAEERTPSTVAGEG
jgi:drug/metabolite transporter (DMT)-like permease